MAFVHQNTGSLLLVVVFVVFAFVETVAVSAAAAKVPAIYVFGDSTADVGNNNYLVGNGVPKANFPHNGIDFPTSRPTGRFSNGYNGIDFLAIHMGFRRSPPAFLSISKRLRHQILKGLKGVNFASAGSGILDSTGTSIPMRMQIEQFATLQSNITAEITTDAADNVLSRSVFLISTGGNDIFASFSQNSTRTNTEAKRFITTLVSAYNDHVRALYLLGARKFALIDVPPIGCCPYPRSLNPLGGCIDVLNELAQAFNKGLKALMHNLSMSLEGFKYSIGSSHEVVLSMIKRPAKLGFQEIGAACCGSGKFNGESGCTPNATLCTNRHQYLFWDLLHPTHATSKLVALAIYNGSLHYAAPINVRQLVEDQC